MRLTKRVLHSVIAIVLIAATLGTVVAMASEGVFAELFSTEKTTYAHGTTVDSKGNFVFTYKGNLLVGSYDKANIVKHFSAIDSFGNTFNLKKVVSNLSVLLEVNEGVTS